MRERLLHSLPDVFEKFLFLRGFEVDYQTPRGNTNPYFSIVSGFNYPSSTLFVTTAISLPSQRIFSKVPLKMRTSPSPDSVPLMKPISPKDSSEGLTASYSSLWAFPKKARLSNKEIRRTKRFVFIRMVAPHFSCAMSIIVLSYKGGSKTTYQHMVKNIFTLKPWLKIGNKQ